MSKWLVGLCLLSGVALADSPLPVAGRYGAQLSIAVGEDQISGWLDRSDQMPQCRVYLYAKLFANRWRLLAYAPATEDLVLGSLGFDGPQLSLQLPRAPRGCESAYRDFIEQPSFRLSQPRQWQAIRLTQLGTAVLEKADPEAAVMQTLDEVQAWAVTSARGGFRAGLALSRDGGIGGWVRQEALLPLLANRLMRERFERPLPGLSAPPTLGERQQWLDLLDWSGDCERRFQGQRGGDGGLALIQLAPQYALLRINCGRAGFQDSFIYAWIRLGIPEQTRLLSFPGFDFDQHSRRITSDHTLIRGQDEIDTAGGTLLIFTPGRSTRDCGQLLRLTFSLEGPALQEWRERSCELPTVDDGELPSPLKWPLKPGTPGAPPVDQAHPPDDRQ